MNRLKKLMFKLKLDKHHRIERFGIMFGSLSLVMILLLGISIHTHIENSKIVLTEKAIYTENFAWSQTGQQGQVLDIFTNKDHTKAFVLVKVDDMTTLSSDASDYQMFLTSKSGKLKNNPSGAIYTFGSTGYMGFYFMDARGFEEQLYDIVVRNTRLVTSDKNSQYDEKNDNMDVSFEHYNQIRIYANLSASKMTQAEFLDKDDATLTDIYAECVTLVSADETKDLLQSDLVTMRDELSKADQYANRLAQLGVAVPALPECIKDDAIVSDVNQTKDNPIVFDKSMLDTMNSVISKDNVLNLNNQSETTVPETIQLDDDSDLYLKTKYVFPNGYNFDFHAFRLTDNRLNDLKKDYTFSQYVQIRRQEEADYGYVFSSSFEDVIKDYYVIWYLKDGTTFDKDSVEELGSTKDKSISENIDLYLNSLSTYYTMKYKYQTEDLFALLQIQNDAQTSADLFSINNAEDVLLIY